MPALRPLALAAGVLMLAVGFVLHPPWTDSLAVHGETVLPWLLALALAAAALSRIARLPLAAGLLAMLGLGLLHFHGFAALTATALASLAALGLGSLLSPAPARALAFGRSRDASPSDAPWLALPIGWGLLAGGAGWLLPFPLFAQWGFIALLLGLVVLLRRRIGDQLHAVWRALASAHRDQPVALTLLTLVLLAASLPSWLPVISADDLASHLQIGWHLHTLGYYRMDVGSQVWSTAPWLSDVAYGLLQLAAGAESVATLNLLWLLLTAFLIVRIGEAIGLEGPLPWLAAMLYASIPLVGGLTMSMQTETASAAAVAALALCVLRAPAQPDRRTLLVAAALSGALVGMKVINGAFVLALAALLLWRWRFAVPWRALPGALLLGAFIGGSSYLYAWTLTGNPLLPLFNGVFQSPWFAPESVVDQRWLKGLGPLLPYWLSFRTADYYEAGELGGAAGFALPLLLFGALAAVADARARPLLLAGMVAWLLPLTQLQYLRYTLPALVLLIPALLAGLASAPTRRSLLLAGGVIVLVQLAFQPSASWTLANGGLQTLVKRGEQRLLLETAAERVVIQQLRSRGQPEDRVLFTHPEHPAHAELAGRGFVANWYDYQLGRVLATAPNESAGWLQVAATSGANLVMVRSNGLTDGLRAFLDAHAGELVASEGVVSLYRLRWPEPPGEEVEAPPGKVAVRFPPASAGDRLVAMRVALDCNKPFAPIAVGWQADRAQTAAWGHHVWVVCPVTGRVDVELVLALPAGWDTVHFEAGAVEGHGDHEVALATHAHLQRPDLARSRDLSRVVRQQVCRRWKMCRELERPLLLRATG